MLESLIPQIEEHCTQCTKRDSMACEVCFFGSVDFGKLNLGSKQVYRRAWHYLNQIKARGFQRNDTFGSRLNIPMAMACA